MTREEAIKMLRGMKADNLNFDDLYTKDKYEALDMAIKALEQQPSEDCVNRAELKKWLDMNFSFGGALRKLEMFDRIDKELPPVLPTQSWIPMVRREPTDEEKIEYLAQNGEELCFIVENEMPLHGQEVLVSIGQFVSEDVFDEDFYNFEDAELSDVDAWMPKPKPYKAEMESEE